MTVLALAFMHIPFLPILKLDGMMVGAIMPMIPGVAFVNAIRDIADTDFVRACTDDRCTACIRIYCHWSRSDS